jgi:hypothetical protein
MVSLTDIMFTNNMNNGKMGDNSRKKIKYFNNISVLSWQPVFLVEETGVLTNLIK